MFSNSKTPSSPDVTESCKEPSSSSKPKQLENSRASDIAYEEHIACYDHQCCCRPEIAAEKESTELHNHERPSSVPSGFYRENAPAASLLNRHCDSPERCLLKDEKSKDANFLCLQGDLLCGRGTHHGRISHEKQQVLDVFCQTQYLNNEEPMTECRHVFASNRSFFQTFNAQVHDEESPMECMDLGSCVDLKHCQPSTQNSENGADDQEEAFSLLSLPKEIITLILQHLPSNALQACMYAHPLLNILISHPRFLDQHIERTLDLGFANNHDLKIRHLTLQFSPSPLMELWFKVYNVMSSRQEPNRILLTRDSLFYPVECFRHTLMTWLVQATDVAVSSMQAELTSQNSEEHLSALVDSFFFKKVLNFPNYVLQPLRKFAVLFPEFLEWTILASHLHLHYDKPKSLKNVWYEGLMEKMKEFFEPKYCMEIICGDTVESFAHQSALIIFFTDNQWAIWTGRVTHFPGCNFVQTWTFGCLDKLSDLEITKNVCGDAFNALKHHTVSDQATNSQWKRRNMFPGMFYLIHQHPRNNLIEKIHEKKNDFICLLHNLTEKHCSLKLSFRSSDSKCLRTFLSQIQSLHIEVMNQLAYYKQTANDQSDSFVTESPSNTHYSKSYRLTKASSDTLKNRCQPFANTIEFQEDDLFSQLEDGEKHQNKRKQLDLNSEIRVLSVDVPLSITQLLDSLFRNEVLMYVSNLDSHQVLCPQCCKLWFPSIESTEACIQEIKCQPFVPYSIWPYHLLNDVLCILDESCSRIPNAC